jgi:ABC-2 type transport system permease protein
VRLYWEVARVTARRLRAYRAATFAGVVTNTVFGYILAYVLLAAVRDGPVESVGAGAFGAADAATFTFVAQGLLVTVGVFGTQLEMAERVKTGEVAIDLARPYDFQGWWAAVGAGRAFYMAAVRGPVPLLVGGVTVGMRWPGSVGVWATFALATALAAGVAFAWGFLLQLCAFWILDVRGPYQIGWLAAQFLSGLHVPVVVFPDHLEAIVRALPFVAMVQLPGELFLGKHPGAGALGVLLVQVGWLGVLVLAGRLVLARAVLKVVVHGG